MESIENKILEELIEYLILNPSIFIDIKKILRNYSLNQKKILDLFKHLEELKIGRCIYPFSHPELSIQLTNHFKFYFFDYDKYFNPDFNKWRQDQKGALLEQYFFSKIADKNIDHIYLFRTKDHQEIDFIIHKNNLKYLCIEIKKDQFIYAGDLSGLHYFDKIFLKEKELFVLHSGTRNNSEGKIKIMPMDLGIQICND
jgi:hypothetical protein